VKVIRYKTGRENALMQVEMGWNETNEEIAKREAWMGEYEIRDDGTEPPADRVADLEEALALLLSGVTE
jgi:hypothetical protein